VDTGLETATAAEGIAAAGEGDGEGRLFGHGSHYGATRVEYEPSELAATLIPHAVALASWAIEHTPDIDAHRAAYDTTYQRGGGAGTRGT
jgi:hypothetical protein